jgi:hypothetical protein
MTSSSGFRACRLMTHTRMHAAVALMRKPNVTTLPRRSVTSSSVSRGRAVTTTSPLASGLVETR